jgi:sialic acid synthase SpsE
LIKKIKEAGANAVKIQTYDENNMTFNSKKGDFVVAKSNREFPKILLILESKVKWQEDYYEVLTNLNERYAWFVQYIERHYHKL